MYINTDVIGAPSQNLNDNYIEEPEINEAMKLIAIHITMTEDFISSFQFELCNNKEFFLTPLIGHKTNRESTWCVPQDENVESIIVYYRHFLHGLVFVTNKGTLSPLFGGETFEKKIIKIYGDLVSYGGTYANHITSVYFIYRDITKKSCIEDNDDSTIEPSEDLPKEYYKLLIEN